MPEPQTMLLKTNLKHLRLPTMGAEFAKLAREASAANEDYEQYLLRLTELEVAARSRQARRRGPVHGGDRFRQDARVRREGGRTNLGNF
jgi:hypothetical protein